MTRTTPSPPIVAAEVFADRLELARRYADLLADAGVVRGLIGPREVPRLWDRHLLNCAVVTELLPHGARVVDVGSGAGLPGVVLAIRRRDVSVAVLEPSLRRVEFLTEAVAILGLDGQVSVVRGRAEDRTARATLGSADWVTARAVAPLDRLAGWCLPLLRPGGALLALKGATAGSEIERHRDQMRRAGAGEIDVVTCGADLLDEPTTVARVWRATNSKEGSR
jgi:16S rRNA (guanine527-N7)-methyltransferase